MSNNISTEQTDCESTLLLNGEGIQVSSGNIFADLGMPNPSLLLAKAELVRQINLLILAENLTLGQTAKHFGVEVDAITNLQKGKLSRFSFEQLFQFLNMLGKDVDIHVVPQSKDNVEAQTIVIAV
jgi:predicted XRE-type DNA-binding protein